MSARSDRRWAEFARELEFTRLPELRRQAEGWRNGLTGLTALLAVLGLLKGRDDLTRLPAWARYTATGLLITALLLLLLGALLALRAAHGMPGEDIVLGGQALRRWTEREVGRVTRSLAWAAVCCVAGLLIVVGTVALSWATTQSDSDAAHPVVVLTESGEVCGELVSWDRHHVVIRVGSDGAGVGNGNGNGKVTLDQPTVLDIRPAASCTTAR